MDCVLDQNNSQLWYVHDKWVMVRLILDVQEMRNRWEGAFYDVWRAELVHINWKLHSRRDESVGLVWVGIVD